MLKRIVHAGLAMLLFGLGLYGSAYTWDIQRERGDVNGDGAINVLDAVLTVNIVLGTSPPPSGEELWAADCNGDGGANVLDVL
ncbi:MAG: dockerin type I repeat-containing protein, partial [Gemmatimonadota bacterium]